jgi:hypothetical protein
VKSRRFFSLLWRVNALVIFAVGIAGVLVLTMAAVMFIKNMTRERHVANVMSLESEQVSASLGNFGAVEGAPLLRAPLHLNQEYEYGHTSKEASSIQNYLYFDPATHSFHWLLPGNRRLILDSTELPASNFPRRDDVPVEAIVYQLVDADTNGDQKLTNGDLKTIAVSDPSGRRFARVLSKVERLNGAHLIGKTKLVLLYTSDGALRAAEFDLSSDKIVRESAMHPLKQELSR